LRMKRSRYSIISSILDICQSGANKTKIVYQANLNFKSVEFYMDLLIKNGMIRANPGKNIIYETTKRGCDLLNHFKNIEKQISEL